MPLSPDKSAQYAGIVASPVVPVPSSDWNSKTRMSYGKLTYTAGGQGTGQIIRLPAGKLRIHPHLSASRNTANATAASTLSIGLGSYVNALGATVAAADAAIVAATAVGAAVVTVQGLAVPVEIESKFGVDVTITWAGANSPVSGDQHTAIAYQMGN